jgi:hypothetical protein
LAVERRSKNKPNKTNGGVWASLFRSRVVLGVVNTFFGAAVGVGAALLFIVPEEKKPGPPPDRPAPSVPAIRGELDPIKLPRILKVVGSKKSYVLRNGVAHSITTGSDYTCNAEYLPVEFNVSERRWQEIVDHTSNEEALCPLGPPPFLRPGLIRDQYMLWQHEKKSPKSKRIWLLRDGRLYPVPTSGPTFGCLTRDALVWDYVSAAEVGNFAQSHHPARCQ